MRVAAIITAKPDASFAEWRLLRFIAEQACESLCARVAVVARDRPNLGDLPVKILASDRPDEGMTASIRSGARWATGEHFDAAIVLRSDQPQLGFTHLNRLIHEHAFGARVVASRYGGEIGLPALFDHSLFSRLAVLKWNEGTRHLLRSMSGVVAIPWPEGANDVALEEEEPFLLRATHK